MTFAVLGITTNHLFGKLAFFYNPNLSNFDIVFFIGIWVSLIYIPAALINGVSLNLLKLRRKVCIGVIISLLLAVAVNNVMQKGISMVSLGKSTLIFNLNPIF